MSTESILLVDDELSVLVSTRWIFEKNNYRVTTAQSGKEAIDLLRRNRYNLLITDLRMGEVNGLTVLQEAKANDPDIRIIVLTGYADVDSAIETLKEGADDYLRKPCDIDELLNKSRIALEKQDLLARFRDQNNQLKNEIAIRKRIELQLQKSHSNLEQKVKKRTAELSVKVDELQVALKTLAINEEKVQEQNLELNDINTALNTLLQRREREHSDMKKELAKKTIEMVLPLLKKAKKQATGVSKGYLETAQTNLLDVFSTHSKDAILTNAKLAPRELQVIHYIRQNKSSKEIADILDLTVNTIESYRENIRKKLRIKNKKINLKKFLTSVS